MTFRTAFALPFICTLAATVMAGPAYASSPADPFPATITGIAGHRLEFSHWDEHFGGWRTLEFHGAGAPLRMYFLAGAPGDANDGTVTETDAGYLSPDKKTVLIERKAFGLVYPPGEPPVNSEQNACDAVSMETGCVLASASINQCDGSWDGNRWKTSEGGIWDFKDGLQPPGQFVAQARTFGSEKGRTEGTLYLLFAGVGSYMACYPPEKNVAAYNDIGFYLAQGGQHALALDIYRRLSSIAPDRVPLKLNIADALWGLYKPSQAAGYYTAYIAAMQAAGKERLIPARALERSRGNTR